MDYLHVALIAGVAATAGVYYESWLLKRAHALVMEWEDYSWGTSFIHCTPAPSKGGKRIKPPAPSVGTQEDK